MSNLNTDLNANPYFDDFDEEKDFYRLLFRPRVPIQARELTQLQTSIQKQIQRFGDHVFKDGSVVEGCHVTYHEALSYVSVDDQFFANTSISVSDIDDTYVLVGNTSGVRAVVLAAETGFEATFPSSNRFYVSYIYTGNSFSEFQRNEYIRVYGSGQNKMDAINEGNFVDQILVLDQVATTGNGYGVSVGDGIIYHKGFFERVEGQTLVIKEFDTDPSGYRVGFDTTESIVTEDQDESLADNALGYPNVNAPGAHRLKLTPQLIKKLRTDDSDSTNFFAIVEFDGTSPTEQHIDATYNRLGEEFAIRTSEESGDYVVKPFSIETFPGINANTGIEDANLFAYSISTGVAYVKGYRVEKIGTSNVVTTRAFTERTSEAQIVTANYGNFVVVEEMMGHFPWSAFAEVTFYDAVQDTITDQEKASGARAGSIIGFANVRDVDFYTGTKGLPACQHIIYLDNIRMNSGKSFSNDVKSIYVTSGYGDARADVVMSNNFYSNGTAFSHAELVDSSFKILVFPIGTTAVKSLNDNVGASDTQFVFRDVANATLQTNGYIAVTLNPAGAGGAERVNASGTLTSLTEKNEFDIILTTDVFTANLSGTVSVNTTTVNVTGTSTTFSTHFESGDYIRVAAESRRINVVTNATFMTVASAWSATNAAANYSRHYLEGLHVDLSSTSANVVITSNTTFAINSDLDLNATVNATSTVMVTYPVLKQDTFPIEKDVGKERWIKIDCSNNSATSVGPWILGLPDVYDVEAVYVGTTYSNTNTDGTTWFNLDTGQRDSFYDLARLEVKPQYKTNITGSTKLLIRLSHLTANASGGVGFFAVDSYPTSNTSNATTIEWGEIPTFRSSDGQFLDLRDCVDVRPQKANTADSSTTEGAATINPAAAANGYATGTYGYIPAPDTNFQADVTYYLPRRDLLVVNKNGDFAVVQGEPASSPITPFTDNDVMLVAAAYVPAWPSLTTREASELNRHDIKIRHDIKTNRRYTMKDVGTIDQRLKRIEYYTVLNAIEQKARDFTIPDVNGLDRFKNGIFADPFNSHAHGKVTDFEYKIAIDQDNSIARPFFEKHQVDFIYVANTSTTQRTGNYVTMPYSHEAYIIQGYASKFRNCTESIWSWAGKLTLYPSYDDHRDEEALPNINVSLDLTSAWEDFASSPFGSDFGDWRTAVATVRSTRGLTTTTTTTTTQTQLIEQMQVDTMESTYDLGSFVKDVSIEPFMRSRMVAFVATNLKPNTVMHAFFDNVNVDSSCAPADWSNLTDPEVGREDRILDRTGAFGDELLSDSTGTVKGLFRIPDGTFRVGDRNFMLIDVDDLITGVDAALTRADARFSASNITLSTQGLTLTTLEPEISVVQTANTRTVVTTTTQQRPRTTTIPGTSRNTKDPDPIAQSIFAATPEDVSGSFITKIDVYFERKDPTMGITMMLTEMRLGRPDTTRIIGKAHLESAEVSTSDDASTATTFAFDHPVFLNSGDTYAFLIKPDGDSPEYRIWLGETGGYDVASGVQIYQNPYAGVAFISSNMNSWTELQKEDIKFTIYRANFTVGSALAYFENEADEYISFSGLIRANTDTTVQVGDICYTANATTTLTGANTTEPYGIVQFIDEANETVYIDTSTSGWAAAQKLQFFRPTAVGNVSLINANSLLANVTIDSVDNLDYHAVVPRFAVMIPGKTLLLYGYKGTSAANTLDTSYISVSNDVEYEFMDTTRIAKSYSNEGAEKSSRYQVTFVTQSSFVSPIIDLRRKSSLMIENIINNDDTNEANTRYGSAITKYVSKNIVLDDGQEAEDMHVWVSAYRPSGTDVAVYAKFHNAEDGENFDLKAWTELERGVGEFNYSSPIDVRDYIEYEYTVPAEAPNTSVTAGFVNTSTGIIRYARTDGAIFESYKTFSLKIVLLSDNEARVPRLNDVRAICLQA